MKKIAPCLWFDRQAEEAARFYVSVFAGSRIKGVARYGAAGARQAGKKKGSVMTVTFEIEGQGFMALNGGPQFQFSPAVSLVVSCETQKEIDALWKDLCAGGAEGPCGWLTDKFGVSWQIVPAFVAEMMRGKDAARADRVMAAILRMKKLDLAALRRAYGGGEVRPRRRA